MDCALAFASRENPKRRYMFVGRLIGRHVPTRPSDLRSAASRLAEKIRGTVSADGKTLFLGMAETATTLAQAIFEELTKSPESGSEALYIDITRREVHGAEFVAFEEAHSHAANLRLYVPEDPQKRRLFFAANRVVVIDDEVTTGNTAANLIRAWLAYTGNEFDEIQFMIVSVVNWAGGVGLSNFDRSSLIEGKFAFVPAFQTMPVNLPTDEGKSRPQTMSRLSAPASRIGISKPEQLVDEEQLSGQLQLHEQRVLVVAVGEFGYLPFRFAELLEAQGREVLIQATTRSPLLVGEAIVHRRFFPALTGENYGEYLYNVPDDHDYDVVVLCGEDPFPECDHPIFNIPRLRIVNFLR